MDPFTETDRRAVQQARGLVLDAVEQAGSGHPGTALALMPLMHLLYTRHLRHDPSDPEWEDRDRFVLSCGHASIMLYTELMLTGYGLDMEDLRGFRHLGSRTPGHPEYGHTAGVETTTGPLAQGLATAVGVAMAFAHQRAIHDPRAGSDKSPFDRTVWVLCSDGDLQEGLSYEAGALAGRHQLGRLNVLYDDNRIQIEGSTQLASNEDVPARFRAQGWQVSIVETAGNGDLDIEALDKAMTQASGCNQPSLIVVRSTIAWSSPNAGGTSASHGAPLGPTEVANTKRVLGLNPNASFFLDNDTWQEQRDAAATRARNLRQQAERTGDAWRMRDPEAAEAWAAVQHRTIPHTFEQPTFQPGRQVATRDASGLVIQALAASLPQLWGGSADLGDSNRTSIDGGGSFVPDNRSGRVIHWGVREGAMAAATNGIMLAGGSIAFAGTFLVFSDYMRPAVRMAALMRLPSIFVWTHDSIALGADGPTHQPIEHLASLRAMPGLSIIRPADALETVAAWKIAATNTDGPIGLVLARQKVPVLDLNPDVVEAGVRAGAYIAWQATEPPKMVIVATGSEVTTAIEAAKQLDAPVRVVSMPCREWYLRLPEADRRELIPPELPRLAVEAAASFGWSDIVGPQSEMITIDRFGASGTAEDVADALGVTVSDVVFTAARMLRSVARVPVGAAGV